MDNGGANLFIVGAAKCGTTSFVEQLAQHTDVFLPKIKEPHYYCGFEKTDWYYYKAPIVKSEKKYLGLYSGRAEKYKIDASVHYMRFESALRNIFENNKFSKIILMYREPVSRINSHYLMDFRSGLTSLSLDEILSGEGCVFRDNYINSSKYMAAYSLLKSVFGERSVLLLSYSDYIDNNELAMTKVFQFLELSYEATEVVSANKFRMPRKGFGLLYRVRWLRILYNIACPSYIRKKVAHFIVDESHRPEASNIGGELYSELIAEFDQVKKLDANGKY